MNSNKIKLSLIVLVVSLFLGYTITQTHINSGMCHVTRIARHPVHQPEQLVLRGAGYQPAGVLCPERPARAAGESPADQNSTLRPPQQRPKCGDFAAAELQQDLQELTATQAIDPIDVEGLLPGNRKTRTVLEVPRRHRTRQHQLRTAQPQ